MKKNRKQIKKTFTVMLFLLLISPIMVPIVTAASDDSSSQTKTVRILATSDLHGRFVPWNYSTNAEGERRRCRCSIPGRR